MFSFQPSLDVPQTPLYSDSLGDPQGPQGLRSSSSLCFSSTSVCEIYWLYPNPTEILGFPQGPTKSFSDAPFRTNAFLFGGHAAFATPEDLGVAFDVSGPQFP